MNFESTVLFISETVKDMVVANPRISNTLMKLIWGSSKSADLKRKRTTAARVFTLKINDSDRILLNFEVIDGKAYIQVLDIILEHNYRDSLLNHPKELKQCISNLTKRDFKNHIKHDLQTSELEATDSTPVQLDEALYYQHQWVVLNDKQNQVVNAPLPLILSGVPGSGKTCIALKLLISAAEQLSDDNASRKAIFITSSKDIVEQVKESWLDNNASKNTSFQVDFMTYHQLIETCDPSLKNKKEVSEAFFNHWFKSEYKPQQKHKIRPAAEGGFKISKEQEALLYQELRIVCAFSEEHYLDIGQKQSFFNSREAKSEVYKLYKSYMAYLEATGCYDPALLEMNLPVLYDFAISDETQDFSNGQLKVIMALAGINFCALFDSNQSMFNAGSIFNCLKSELYAKEVPYSYKNLTESYRFPEDVAGFATIILGIKKDSAGRSGKEEAERVFSCLNNEEAGQVVWLESLKDPQMDYLKQLATGTTLAVVTLAEFIDEAREIYGTELVFTPEQIKGQQFNTVVAHRPFEDPGLIEASQLLKSKGLKDTRKLRPAFNRLFTTITRAQQDIFVVQKPYHQSSSLIHLIKDKLLEKNLLSSEQHQPQVNLVSEEASWLEQFHRQIKHKNLDQAQRILEKKLNNEPKLYKILRREQQLAFDKDQALPHLKPDETKHFNEQQPSAGASASNPIDSTGHKTRGRRHQTVPKTSQRKKLPAIKATVKRPDIFNQLQKSCSIRKLKQLFEDDQYLEALFTPYPDKKDKTLHYSFFYFLLIGAPYPELLKLLQENPEYCKKITGALLRKKAFIGGLAVESTSNLNLLIYNKNGLLKLLIDINPALLNAITKEDLFSSKVTQRYIGFFFLVSTEEGLYCLRRILEVHPEFYLHINEALLLTEHQLPAEYVFKQGSAFSPFLVSNVDDGQHLLFHLLDKRPELCQKFTFQHLYLPYKDDNFRKTFINPFRHLSYTQVGISILNKIIRANPDLMAPKYIGFIFNPYGDSPAVITNLLCFSEGIKLVRYILNTYPEELYDKLNIDELFTLYGLDEPRSPGNAVNTSFSSLCSEKGGLSLLFDILEHKPQLFKKINYNALFGEETTFKNETEKYIENNFICLMIKIDKCEDAKDLTGEEKKDEDEVEYVEGLDLLIDVLDKDPSIANKIPPDFFDWNLRFEYGKIKIRDLLEKDKYWPLKMKLEELNPSLFENKQVQRINVREAPGFFRPAPEPDAASEEKIVSPTGP